VLGGKEEVQLLKQGAEPWGWGVLFLPLPSQGGVTSAHAAFLPAPWSLWRFFLDLC